MRVTYVRMSTHHSYVIAGSLYTHKMSSKFTCIFHSFLLMLAVKMSHSGGIINFFDFNPLPKFKNYESLYITELIATQFILLEYITVFS